MILDIFAGGLMDTREMIVVSKVTEFNYKIKFDIINILGDFQNLFIERYPYSANDRNSGAFLRDKEDETEADRNITLTVNSFGQTCGRYNELCDSETIELIDFVAGKVKINEFIRAGIRFNFLLPINNDDQEKEFAVTFKKIFGKNAVRQLGNKIGKFKVEFMTKTEDGHQYNIAINFAQRTNDNEELPQFGLMIDIDTYLEDVNLEDLKKFAGSALNRCKEITIKFLNSFLVRSER
jgi:hypothetical protein